MTAPTIDPDQRDPDDVAPTDTYRPSDPVWVHLGGAWCAGRVEAASKIAATVTYRPTESYGTGVDTLTARYVAPRFDLDPVLDKPPSRGITRIRPVAPVRSPGGREQTQREQGHREGSVERFGEVPERLAPVGERLATVVERIAPAVERLVQSREGTPRAS